MAYRNGEKLADIDAADIHRYVGQPDCFVWVALLDPDLGDHPKPASEDHLKTGQS